MSQLGRVSARLTAGSSATVRETLRTRGARRPRRRVGRRRVPRPAYRKPRTASAIFLMCAGVLPQQAPTRRAPAATIAGNASAMASGVRS